VPILERKFDIRSLSPVTVFRDTVFQCGTAVNRRHQFTHRRASRTVDSIKSNPFGRFVDTARSGNRIRRD